MSLDSADGIQSVSNLVYSGKVVIHQGENAHNIINVINRQQDVAESPGVEIIGKVPKGQGAVKENEEDNDDDCESEDFPVEKVQEAMEEIAKIQLCDQSQLQTLTFLVDHQVQLQDAVGFLQTRTKIDALIQTLATIEGPFLLAAEYKKCGKEFQAVIICKHLVTWAKCNIEKEGGAMNCIKKMTEHYMSLASDAAIKLLRSKSAEKEIYKSYLAPLMYEMLAEIEEVECGETCFKATCEAIGGYYVACIHLILEEWSETCEVCNREIKRMEEKCKNPKKKHIYADIMSMAGLAKFNMDELRHARKLWKKTIKALKAEGNDDPQKEGKATIVQGWLNVIRVKLSAVPKKIEMEVIHNSSGHTGAD